MWLSRALMLAWCVQGFWTLNTGCPTVRNACESVRASNVPSGAWIVSHVFFTKQKSGIKQKSWKVHCMLHFLYKWVRLRVSNSSLFLRQLNFSDFLANVKVLQVAQRQYLGRFSCRFGWFFDLQLRMTQNITWLSIVMHRPQAYPSYRMYSSMTWNGWNELRVHMYLKDM